VPRFTKAQKEWSWQVLHGLVDAKKAHVASGGGETSHGVQRNDSLKDVLIARVINGETLDQAELLNAKQNLTASEYAELQEVLP
jgi:hypothetical protein